MTTQQRIQHELDEIGPRLRAARLKKDVTLEELAETTAISKSTLSRLESGQRKPSLELLLPVVAALGIALDDIVTAQKIDDPRVQQRVTRTEGRGYVPLSSIPGDIQAYKVTIPANELTPSLRTHDGFEWLFVLAGRLRLVLGEHDIVLGPGEAAEFDTRNPHWLGASGGGDVELLSLFGKHGERVHVRARPVASRA